MKNQIPENYEKNNMNEEKQKKLINETQKLFLDKLKKISTCLVSDIDSDIFYVGEKGNQVGCNFVYRHYAKMILFEYSRNISELEKLNNNCKYHSYRKQELKRKDHREYQSKVITFRVLQDSICGDVLRDVLEVDLKTDKEREQ
jgi:hypothetical protein